MEKQVKVTRIFDAPVEEVWKLWTVEEYVMQWWGPDKFTCPSARIQFKEGDTSLVSMQAPDEYGGRTTYSIWTYKKIVHLQSIEFVQNLSDENGKKVNPVSIGLPPDFPEDVRTLVTFQSMGEEKTEMTVIEFADFGQMSYYAELGLKQSLNKAASIFR